MKLRGRPRKYAEYDALLAGLPKVMVKRPKYLNGIGVFRGAQAETAWVKIRLPHGGVYGGRSYSKGSALEIKVGNLSSWPWKELEAKRDELQGKADRAEPLEKEAPRLFSDHATDWLDRLKRRTEGYSTAEIHLNAHLLKVFGKKTLDAIRVGDVDRYVSGRLSIAKPSTVAREVSTLKAILNDAIRGGLLEQNPARHADKIKGIVPRQRFIDPEETLRLLSEAKALDEWLADFVLWCLHSGMRKGEVLGLKWSSVRALPNGRHIVQVERSKSDRPRIIPCTETMVQILARQRRRQVEKTEKEARQPERNGSKAADKAVNERVFPIARITLRRKWEAARTNAKLGDVTIHDLRRTHSTQAVVAGVDLRTLAGRLGHSSLAMLDKHYAALVGTASIDAAEKIEKAFGLEQQKP
jgi:integrase